MSGEDGVENQSAVVGDLVTVCVGQFLDNAVSAQQAVCG